MPCVPRGDFVETELRDLTARGQRPGAGALRSVPGPCADRKALLFTPTVALAYALAETFQAAGIAAEALDGTTARYPPRYPPALAHGRYAGRRQLCGPHRRV